MDQWHKLHKYELTPKLASRRAHLYSRLNKLQATFKCQHLLLWTFCSICNPIIEDLLFRSTLHRIQVKPNKYLRKIVLYRQGQETEKASLGFTSHERVTCIGRNLFIHGLVLFTIHFMPPKNNTPLYFWTVIKKVMFIQK